MPVTTLTIPALIQPVQLNGQDVYHVRPLFFDSPVATHRRYADAVSQFKGLMKRRFAGYQFRRQTAEQLLWFKFGPEVKLSHFNYDFSIGSHFVMGKFSVASFELHGNVFACLPSLGNFMFIAPKDERGKHDLKAAAGKTIRELLRKFKQNEGNDFDASQYYTPRREFLTIVRQEVSVKDGAFSFEDTGSLDIFASFRNIKEFEGSEEIEKVGQDLCAKYPDELRRAWYQDELVLQLYDLIFRRGNTPTVIVGREGVGKHTIIDEVAYRYMQAGDKPNEDWKRHYLWHINPNRIIAGMSIVGYWERRFEAILKYVQKPQGRTNFPDKILIDNPVALLRIGKAAQSDLSLANVLKPYLEKRLVQVILLATPEEWKIIQESDRSFSDLFQVLRVPEPDLKTAIKITLQNRRLLELRNECNITVPAISQLFTIQRNYLKNKALPGSVMKLLTQLTAKHSRQTIDAPEVREEFKAFSGLQERIFDEQTTVEETEISEILAHELVGQPKAVEALSQAIHLIKAKMTDRNRPLASFLFIGPTGVGKTHAAKLLCKTILGSEDHLLRFDMNEYIDEGALHRLIGDYYNPEGQLTGKVRYRPFSVILLDEIEKANPAIHDLLLQVLDDARLTDSLGRTVDFSNTIIVMTSNLGAREVGSQIGYSHGEPDDEGVYRKAIENFFRPEMVNRIERITVFNPLNFSEIQKIAQLQIRELLQRDGFVRRTTIVNVSQEALDWVARRGFDARMGGRALKRQIERDLTLLSAEQLIKTTTDTPLILDIFFENDHLVPHITPLEFIRSLDEKWLPALPDEDNANRFFSKLLKKFNHIDRQIENFEQRRQKKGHLLDVGAEDADWKHYDFKNKVFDLKEDIQFKQLRRKERKQQMTPVLPFRLKRVYLSNVDDLSSKARKEILRDKFFQEEALKELREEYRHLSPQFDSAQTDYLLSYLDLAFLELMLEGFLHEKTDKVTLRFESCVTNAGGDEIEFLVNHYAKFFEKLDIPIKIAPDRLSIRVEEHSLGKLLAGEEGMHLFYLSHNIPIPIRLTVETDGAEARKSLKVIRIYDGMDTVTDLRTGYTTTVSMTPDEFKLLVYGGALSQ